MTTIGKWMSIGCLSVLPATLFAQTKIEYFWDTDPGIGRGTELISTSDIDITANFDLPTSGLSLGVHSLNVRALSSQTSQTTLSTHYFFVGSSEEHPITKIEYFLDEAPGHNPGTALNIPAGQTTVDLSAALDASSWSRGLHKIYLRAWTDNYWSSVYDYSFLVPDTHTENIEKVEYFWDNDPGVGKGSAIDVGASADLISLNPSLSVSGLEEGLHRLGLRAKTDSYWSCTYMSTFFISNVPTQNIGSIEYFWDDDPGEGKGTSIAFSPSTEVSVNTPISTEGLAEGVHRLSVRAKSENHWSNIYASSVMIKKIETVDIKCLEYFWDTDPGIGRAMSIDFPSSALGTNYTFDLDASALTAGVHCMGLRALTDQTWSQTEYRVFMVPVEGFVARIEYYWDDDDPGIGNAIPLDFTPAYEVNLQNVALSLSGLTEGRHRIHFRAISDTGNSTESAGVPFDYVNGEGIIYVDGIALNITELKLVRKSDEQLIATVTPDNASNKNIAWSVDDPTVVSVENGKVTALKVGNAVVTATTTDGTNLSAQCFITVLPILVQSIELNYSTVTLDYGQNVQLTATVYPEDADNKEVLWVTSDDNVVSVNSEGLASFVDVGEATVSAQATDGSGVEATCIFTVVNGLDEIRQDVGTQYIYTVDGQQVSTTRSGIYIIRNADGTTSKVHIR